MSKIRGMLASPLHTGERSTCRTTTSLSLLQSEFCVKLITFPSKRGETSSCALTQKNVESRISLRQRRYSVGTSSSSRIKKEQGDHTLSEATSEILKQECRAERADCAIRELQRQLHSSRLEIDHTYLGNEKSWREQARLHEELAQRERALRETHTRSVHKVQQLKRAQEMRIDDFFRQELKESQATINELTAPIQELQERVNLVSDSRMFQEFESACSGRLSHIPSQQAVVPSPRRVLSRDQSLRLDT